MHGGGDVRRTPPLWFFCPLLKKSSGNPYLKILDFSQLFIADAPMKKKSKNLVLPPRRALLGHPVQKYFKFFCFNQKIFLHPLVEIIFRHHKIWEFEPLGKG